MIKQEREIMPKCEWTDCSNPAVHTVKVKKSEGDDRVHKVCTGHRDQHDTDCKQNGWEFLELK